MTRCKNNSNSIKMEGGSPLGGSVRIQGSKNAALPIMAACLLIPGKCTLRGCPDITDVAYMIRLLESTGAGVEVSHTAEGIDISIDAGNISGCRLPSRYVKAMRSSVILMGALLGRTGEAYVDYPGGCVIGERPIDMHLSGLEKLGAQIWTEGNRIHAYADELAGAQIRLPFSSVGATQNIILAAATAKGTTVIKNAAREPEITVLCEFLNKAGAEIILPESFWTEGRLIIKGTPLSKLHAADFDMIPDRIVTGTYMFAAMAAGGSVNLENVPIEQLHSVCAVISKMGGSITYSPKGKTLKVSAPENGEIKNIDFIETDVYPGFPTDLQSPLMAAASTAKGSLTIKESIFSSRFKIAEELRRMGADIVTDGDTAVIKGVAALLGRNVIAHELRGGAALVIAGLAASGITTVSDISYINRGYQDIVGDLRCLGARISYE